MNVGTSIVAPAIGVIIGNALFSSCIKSILDQRKLGVGLGSLNPTPFPLIVANCVGWVAYGLCAQDNWIFWGNTPGCLIGLWTCFSAVELCGPEEKLVGRKIMYQCMGFVLLWILVGYVGVFVLKDLTKFRFLLGMTCSVVLGLFYGAPLTTLAKVVRQRDSSSLYPPLCALNFLSGAMWSLYGLFATNDPFVYGPNLVGALFGTIQLCLCVICPRRTVNEDTATDKELETVRLPKFFVKEIDLQGPI
jgi:solute carrier family 50 protein (sugar transporter)